MWGSFMDQGLALAEKAKKAAEDLDKQLNESVGVPAGGEVVDVSESKTTTDDDDALDDNWDDDGLDDIGLDSVEESPNEAIVAEAAVADGGETEIVEKGDDPHANDTSVSPDTAANVHEIDAEPENGDDAVVDQDTPSETQVDVIPPEEIVTDEVVPAVTPPSEDQTTEIVAELPDEPLDENQPVPASEENLANGNEMTNAPGKTAVLMPCDNEDLADKVGIPDNSEETNGSLNSEERVDGGSEIPIPKEVVTEHCTDKEVEPETAQPQQVERIVEQQSEYTETMEKKMKELQSRLDQREDQLFSKTEQLTTMESMHEVETKDLMQKIQNTKEEAKRRIQKAKERVESVEQKLKNMTASQSSSADDAGKQADIITALREEGEKLARKQADMEAAVRSAKGEARGLNEELESTVAQKDQALEKISKLEAELKSTLENLSSARQGESQAGKLDSDLRLVREESEKRASQILTLEQEVKELKATQKDLNAELNDTRKGAEVETLQEKKKLRKEHNDLVSDLEAKLHATEREAAVREDALRHEVDELRKRWQDAVRRADSLSVDVQSSTAPLLRQLESTNKQARARAAAWTELETQLRSELEESVIANEQLSKERSEWKTKYTRLERSSKDHEKELKQLKADLYEKTERVQQVEHQLEEMEKESAKMKAEWTEVERLANEGVSRVRSEMTKTVVDAEERHRSQVEQMEGQLRRELDQRTQLEMQVKDLLDNAGVFATNNEATSHTVSAAREESKPKKLRQSEGQAEILAGALSGFELDEQSDSEDEGDTKTQNNGGSSFAALEQLTSRLKASKVELTTLRNRLAESEKSRDELLQVLSESRNAREKLPLFEAKVNELTHENRELIQEVDGLRADIQEVRELYRTQLNVLLEAQAKYEPSTNGATKEHESAAKEVELSIMSKEDTESADV